MPFMLDSVPVTLIGSQLVGLKTNSGRLMSTLTVLTWKGMPSLPVGSAPFGDRDLRSQGVDVHGRSHDFAVTRADAEVERTGLLGDVDREAERRAVVGAGEEHLAALDEDRFGTGARARRDFADLASTGQVPSAACGSPHSGTFERFPETPGGS